MKSFTGADLERLARGQRLEGELFCAILSEPAAVADLARLLQVEELLEPAVAEALEPTNLPEMDVSFEEVNRYLEGRSLEASRRAAVERFLNRHYPAALTPPSSTDTHVEFRASDDTALEFRADVRPKTPRQEPPPA